MQPLMSPVDPRRKIVVSTELYDRFQRALVETGRTEEEAMNETVCEAIEAWLKKAGH